MVAQLTLTSENPTTQTHRTEILPTEAAFNEDNLGMGFTPAAAEWQRNAACAADGPAADAMLDLFFSEELAQIAAAKRICAECPVMAQCLEGAMERREPWGVWGGQLFTNGRVLLIKRRRGRPRKVTRPEDEVPTIPVPEHLVPMLRTA